MPALERERFFGARGGDHASGAMGERHGERRGGAQDVDQHGRGVRGKRLRVGGETHPDPHYEFSAVTAGVRASAAFLRVSNRCSTKCVSKSPFWKRASRRAMIWNGIVVLIPSTIISSRAISMRRSDSGRSFPCAISLPS